jgi:hypothetical protein
MGELTDASFQGRKYLCKKGSHTCDKKCESEDVKSGNKRPLETRASECRHPDKCEFHNLERISMEGCMRSPQ